MKTAGVGFMIFMAVTVLSFAAILVAAMMVDMWRDLNVWMQYKKDEKNKKLNAVE